MSTGLKISTPVDYETAQLVFNQSVEEKTVKGYTPGEDGTPYRRTGKEAQISGIHCQLLNPINGDQLDSFLDDPLYCLQENFDGRRLLIRKDGRTVTGINRFGLIVALPGTIAASAQSFACDLVMDGEAVGDQFYTFDLLTLNGTDLRHLSYQYRCFELMEIVLPKRKSAIRIVPSTTLPGQKREILERLRAANREDVVFRRFDAPYTAGRPASGPIPHIELVRQVEQTLKFNRLVVGTQARSLSHDNARCFGLMEIQRSESDEDYCWVLGLRNSHDKTFPAGIVAGSQVFCCDNLAFSGEVKLARKHTRFITRDLPRLVQTAFGKLMDRWHHQDVRLASYKLTDINDACAHDLVIRACDVGVCPNRHIPQVLQHWRKSL